MSRKVWYGCDQGHIACMFIHHGTSLARVKQKAERRHAKHWGPCAAQRMFLGDTEEQLRDRIARVERPGGLSRLAAAIRGA
jgi:hypothetical protein